MLCYVSEQYRAKWGLSPMYPMVAPNYAARRSELAKQMGLGQVRQKPVVTKTTTDTRAIGEVDLPLLGTKANRKPPGRPRKMGA